MAQVLAIGDAMQPDLLMHNHKVGFEHWGKAEKPLRREGFNFVESLGSELQHFDDAELERMRLSLSWLVNHISLTLKLKAKVRELPSIPPTNESLDAIEVSKPVSGETRTSPGPLTENEKAAVETMFRVEGLVDLLQKRLPGEELLGPSVSAAGNAVKKSKGQQRKDGGSAPGKFTKRKGNKIVERDSSPGRAGAPLGTLSEVISVCKSDDASGSALNNEGVPDLTEAGGNLQQNGDEASRLPVEGEEDTTDSGGGSERGSGDAGQEKQDAADGHGKSPGQGAGEDNQEDGGNNGGDDEDGQTPQTDEKSVKDQLAEIQSSLAHIGRQHKIAQGVLVYLIISTSIPAFTLIRWKIRSLRIINPIKKFQRDMEHAILGKTDDSVIDDLLPWKSSDVQETDAMTQQFQVMQEALGGPSEEDAQVRVEADMRAARSHAKKHWWQIGPLRPPEDPELLRTRTERAHLKRLAPLRFILEFVGQFTNWGASEGALSAAVSGGL